MNKIAPLVTGKRQGKVGDMLCAGEVVLTSTGRETTPFPRIDTSTNRKVRKTLKQVDAWLIDNAIAEAKSRSDRFNLRMFEAVNKAAPTQAEKDSAEYYLFDPEFVFSAEKTLFSPTAEASFSILAAA